MSSSSSSSENKTTNTTQNFDERVAATDNAVAIVLQDGASVDLDGFGSEDLGQVFQFTGDSLRNAADFLGDQLDAERKLVEQSFDIVAENTLTQDTTIAETLLTYGAVIAVATVAAKMAPQIMKGL